MGNKVVRCDFVLPVKQPRLSTYLTTEQIYLVQHSWELIKDDLSKLGIIVFLRFFETQPEMKSFFPKIVRMNNDNELEWDVDREKLQKHAQRVMEGLGAAVESLDDSDFLNRVLISVGQTHFHRQIKAHMLKRLWPPLSYGLQRVLQDAYTRDVSEAWKKVFDYMCVYMKHGLDNPDIDPDTHPVVS